MGKLFKFALAIFLIGVGCIAIFSIISEDSLFNSLSDDDYIYQELVYDADAFTGFDFDFENRDFIIRTSDNDEIKITYYTTEKDPVTVDETTETLKLETDIEWIDQLFSGWIFLLGADEYYDVYIYLPDSVNYNLDLDTSNGTLDLSDMTNILDFRFNTSNGRITLSDISAENINLDSSNGNVTLTNVTSAEDIDVYTSNGSITLDNCEATDLIKLKSSNGGLYLSNVIANEVTGDTSNQRIEAINITTNDLSLDTSNGRIEVSINGDKADYEVRMSTSNGDLNYDGIEVSQESFNVGADNLVELESSNGDVTITFID